MSEARVEGGAPVSAGWFVVNARDAPWQANALRTMWRAGGEGEAHFDQIGLGLYWLRPGQAMAMYHHEAGQEDFLVLQGSCVLVVEGEERAARAWDLIHCPPRVPHTIVGAGDEPALVLAVGARVEQGSARYPWDERAAAHDAAVRDGETPDEAYDRFGPYESVPPPPVF